MMQECPKCHFVQPKDRYCANCGLDIESFVPAPEAALQKFRRKSSLHITIVVILILGVATVIYLRERDRIIDHFRNAPRLSMVKTSDIPTSSEGEPETFSRDEQGELKVGSPIAPVAGTPAGAQDQKASSLKRELIFTFAEASTTLLQQLASEGQILNETAQRRSFLHSNLPKLEKLRERDPEFRVLHGGQTFQYRPNAPMVFDFTHLSGAQNMDVGLNLEIQLTRFDEGAIEFGMQGLLSLQDEANNPITNQEINANFNFTHKSTLVMVGFLPRQHIKAEDVNLFEDTPLAIYESDQFHSGITDFVIFIQAK